MPETPPTDDDEMDSPPGWRRWAGPVGLVLALLWLAGAVGYVVGVRSSEPELGEVDRGFVVDMSDHHDQAVELALYELENGSDPVALDFAREVILLQRSELGEMAMLMAQHGMVRPDPSLDRPVMGWMGMPTSLGSMPGWADESSIEALRTSSGAEADLLFLELMQDHHAGGVHMAEFASENAEDPQLRELAARMARNQRIEVNEYQQVIDRLSSDS